MDEMLSRLGFWPVPAPVVAPTATTLITLHNAHDRAAALAVEIGRI